MSIAADMSVCTAGGPVTGAQDKHCYDDGGANFIAVDPAMCTIDAGDTGGGPGDFGDTMYNTSGNDDDCKYAVSYTIPGRRHLRRQRHLLRRHAQGRDS